MAPLVNCDVNNKDEKAALASWAKDNTSIIFVCSKTSLNLMRIHCRN